MDTPGGSLNAVFYTHRDEPSGVIRKRQHLYLFPCLFLLIDVCLLLAVWILFGATVLPHDINHTGVWPKPQSIALWICLCTWLATQGQYTSRNCLSTDVLQIAGGVLLASFVEWTGHSGAQMSGTDLAPWIAVLLLVPIGRLTLKWALFRFGPWRLPTAVIGSATQCALVSNLLIDDWYRGFLVRIRIPSDNITDLSIESELSRLLRVGTVKHVLIALDGSVNEAARAVAQIVCRKRDLSFGIVLPWAGVHGDRFTIDRFFGNDSIVLRKVNAVSPQRRAWLKRCVDVSISLTLLFFGLPLMVLIGLLVRQDGGPIFYGSQRLGRGGKAFSALKFRTMAPDADRRLRDMLERDPQARQEWETNFKIRHDPRITAVGRILRNLSLDELPQLINVVKGDMSLVGPRPILPAERTNYGEAFDLYCQCVPGLTGPWQISGRNNLDYQRRIELNTWYFNNASIWVDIIILFRTLPMVVRRIGAV